MVHCRACGRELHESAITCPQCGAAQPPPPGVSEHLILPAFLLCFFFGWLGGHRYYVGKVGTGVLMLCTFGGLGLWVLIDLIMIIVGAFTDKAGHRLTRWS